MGEKEKLLSTKLEAINVVRQAYCSNAMVGNHCFRNHRQLTDVLDDDPDTKAKFDAVFKCFHEIMILVSAKRFLDDSEVARVRVLCNSFAILIHNVFPEEDA